MYCSSCGVAIAQGLSYCNYCGAKLSDARSDRASPEVKPETLVGAMVGAFVLGLAAITVLIGVMKAVLHLDTGLIISFAWSSFLIMLSLEAVFIWLLLHRKRGAKQERETSERKATTELDATQPRALAEGVPSVTEHTTRAFDPVHVERTSKRQ